MSQKAPPVNTLQSRWFSESWYYHELVRERAGVSKGFEEQNLLALELAGEVGELANLFKKRWRDGIPPEQEAQWLAKVFDELADVRGTLEYLEHAMGHYPPAGALHRIDKLRQRYPQDYARWREQSFALWQEYQNAGSNSDPSTSQ